MRNDELAAAPDMQEEIGNALAMLARGTEKAPDDEELLDSATTALWIRLFERRGVLACDVVPATEEYMAYNKFFPKSPTPIINAAIEIALERRLERQTRAILQPSGVLSLPGRPITVEDRVRAKERLGVTREDERRQALARAATGKTNTSKAVAGFKRAGDLAAGIVSREDAAAINAFAAEKAFGEGSDLEGRVPGGSTSGVAQGGAK